MRKTLHSDNQGTTILLKTNQPEKMKRLKDYSEDIYKCTKCGFCQAICPIYKETGLETAVSRGKFTLLHGILNGRVDFTPKIAKYLDMCLGCRACYDFCPAGISAEEIITAARNENFRINSISLLKKFIIWCFKSNIRLKLLKFALDIYKKSGLIPVVDKISGFSGRPGKLVQVFNQQLKENIQYKKLTPVRENSGIKVAYFPGCIGSYVNPSAKNAVIMVLEKHGVEVIMPKNLSCCGISSRSAGDYETFRALAEKNLRAIPSDINYLITDCASCGSAWEFYPEFFEGELKQKAEEISRKAVNINKFLDETNLYIPEGTQLKESVTYHDPCHLARFQRVTEEPRNILKKIPGIDYREMEEADICCGAAGTFCVSKPGISLAISKRKAQNVINTEAGVVSTSCSACKIGLANGLVDSNTRKKLISPVELLAKLYIQEEKGT